MNRLRSPINFFGFNTGGQAEWGLLSPAGAELLDRSRRVQPHRRGDAIFLQGDESRGVYCVESGHVLLWRIDAFGNETVFGIVAPGEIMGYRSCFAEEPHAATARALIPCRVWFISRATVDQLLDDNPAIARWFLRMIARDRGPREGLLLRGHHLPVRVRLVNLLLVLRERFAETFPDGRLVFELPLARHEIAAMLGVRPETITRTIRELEDEGVASFNGREVAVPKLEKLLDVAGFEAPV